MPTVEEIVFVGWFFALGGVIGSFLNVVVHRLPQGMSLIEPPSHCPKCKHRIRWYDNVPMLGWLLLRGKCRDCGQPISPRYPLVELTTALMFGILTAVEFAFHGGNLPQRVTIAGGLPIAGMSTDQLYLILLYHALLLCILLCGALIEFDRHRPPAGMYVWAILIGLIFPLKWAMLRPVKAWPEEPAMFAGGIDGLLGLAAGGLLGYAAWRIQGSKQPGGLPLALVCVGVFLGWQAVLPLGIFAAIAGVSAAAIFPGKRQEWLIPTSAWLWILTFSWILCWAPLVRAIKLS